MSLVLLCAVLLGGCSGTSERREDKQLIVSGSTTVLPIAEEAADGFHTQNPNTKVLVSGLGSSAGIEAVTAGTADIGTSSRDLKPEELTAGLIPVAIANDGIAIIVNPSNPVGSLSMKQLRAIYSGQITNWKQVGGPDRRIDLVNRDEASGTREAFKKIVMGAEGTFNLEAAVLPGTGQVRDVVSRSPGAIGYISLGFVATRFSSAAVKALVIDGVTPSEKTVASRKYPLSRSLYMITKGKPQGLAKSFMSYVLSPAVQNGTVREAGFVPATSGGK